MSSRAPPLDRHRAGAIGKGSLDLSSRTVGMPRSTHRHRHQRLHAALCRLGLALLLLSPPGPARAANEDLPLPRFASLRSNEGNLRTGPGTNYPVDWVLTRRAMPVPVLAGVDIWRKTPDWP